MSILPYRCGNSNRSDLQQIASSLLAQRGNAITTQVGSIMWVETQAWARAIYNIWAVNQKMAYQFDPDKMTDFLPRWNAIMGLAALPTDTIQTQQARIAARFAAINNNPDTQAVTDLLEGALGITFLALLNVNAEYSAAEEAVGVKPAYVQFPGGTSITGGTTNVGNGPWLSCIQELFIEVTNPPTFTNNQFYSTVNTIFPILGQYLPAYDTFDWFWSSFSDDGYASAGTRATISVMVGSTTVTGVGTGWLTPINPPDGTENIHAGSIIEARDNDGNWQRMLVQSIQSNTSLTLVNPAVSTITAQPYVIQGFFLDCNPAAYPYPPTNCLNLDNAGLNDH
jgi:hypothetical protein